MMGFNGITYNILWKVDRSGFSDDDLDLLIDSHEGIAVDHGRILYATSYDEKTLIVESID